MNRNFTKPFCLLTLLLLLAFSASASNAEIEGISGQVTDAENNEPLVGATIYEPASGRGTVTDFDGKYVLNVSQVPTTIEVSYTGYVPQVVEIDKAGSFDVALSASFSRLDEVVVVGTRGKPRTILDSAVPIDNINAAELKLSGQNSLEQMINYRVPSYNSSNQTISDATAHFDPSELRNLGPSRTLVLVNGKRKNQSALVYVNDTPGKGEVGVDMKSIPTEAIERVEVLRDGAAAQYGSDAIAGVINIVLKESTAAEIGAGIGVTTQGDGLTSEFGMSKGFKIGKGNLNLSGSYYHQDYTDRAGEPGKDDLFGVDGTNPFIMENPDLGMIVGQPEYDKFSGFANFSLPYSEDLGEIYAFGGYTYRDGRSFALYRTPYWITDDAGLLTPAGEQYDGFQPTFETRVGDYMASVGNKYNFNGWNTDISFTTGSNKVDYTIGNSINPSLLPNSPISFDPGGYTFGNIIGNLDVSKVFGDLSIGVGVEGRQENFEVRVGEEASYVDGGVQSFPGLQPANALEADRTNVGFYGSVDYDITNSFLLGGAVRYENYSDFGDNVSWKVAGRYKIGTNKGAIRASVSTGFRAPSLHQIYLSNVQTLVSGGTISNQGTFNNVDPVIHNLGIPGLDAETSFNYTAGITYKLAENLSITADYYNIAVDNRVLFTGEIGEDGDPNSTNQVEQVLIDNSVTSIKFFVNALDTKTSGFDLVLDYQNIDLGEKSDLDLILSVNINKTEIDGAIVAPGIVGEQGYDIFSRKEQSRVTTARPGEKVLLGANFKFGNFRAALNNTYFGEVTWQHATDEANDQTFSAKVITDLILGYQASEHIDLTLTANNLFDIYPDVIDTNGDVVTDLGGRFLYPWEVNQFGFLGTVVKLGINYKLR